MLTGRLPFKGEHSHALLYSIMHEKPADISEFRQDLPPQVVECLRRCLTTDRDKRPKTALALLDILDGGTGHSTERLAFFQRRSIPIKPILAFFAVLILAWGVWFFWSGSSATPGRTVKQPRVGILLFADHSGRSAIASLPVILQSLLVQELTSVRELRVVDPLSLNDFLAQKWGEKAPRPNIANYRLLQELDITQVIDGTIIAEGQSIILQAWVVDTDTAEVVSSRQCRFDRGSDLQTAVRNLAKEIVGDFQVHDLVAKLDEDVQPMVSPKATSPEALRAFLLAGECIYKGNPQAEEYLRRSISLDPDFIPRGSG